MHATYLMKRVTEIILKIGSHMHWIAWPNTLLYHFMCPLLLSWCFGMIIVFKPRIDFMLIFELRFVCLSLFKLFLIMKFGRDVIIIFLSNNHYENG